MDIVLLIHRALTNLTTVMCNIHNKQNSTNINDNTDANSQNQVKHNHRYVFRLIVIAMGIIRLTTSVVDG